MPRKSAHLVKGSLAAKQHMAKLRAMKSGSGIKHHHKVKHTAVHHSRVGGAVSLAARIRALKARIARL